MGSRWSWRICGTGRRRSRTTHRRIELCCLRPPSDGSPVFSPNLCVHAVILVASARCPPARLPPSPFHLNKRSPQSPDFLTPSSFRRSPPPSRWSPDPILFNPRLSAVLMLKTPPLDVTFVLPLIRYLSTPTSAPNLLPPPSSTLYLHGPLALLEVVPHLPPCSPPSDFDPIASLRRRSSHVCCSFLAAGTYLPPCTLYWTPAVSAPSAPRTHPELS